MKNTVKIFILLLVVLSTSCSDKNKMSDAYGNFEATEVIVSAEGTGKIIKFDLNEGQQLKSNIIIGFIDTTDLLLRKEQLMAQKRLTSVKTSSIKTQIEVQQQQKANLIVDKNRIDNLYKSGAATKKQVDDVNGSIDLVNKQIQNILVQNQSISDELNGIEKQIAQVEESIKRCYIDNPVNGTVLSKYAEQGEFATTGKSLYKIADLDYLDLRAYVSGSLLPSIKIGQKAEVVIDKDADNVQKLQGEVIWISSNAEFTPKIIQTREERINLVYAVKIRVKNDGTIKIGMPGEVNFK